jgi:FixJ family two-component response regulator
MSLDEASRGQVFVLDDDPLTRESLSSSLGEEGYEVIFFSDGGALLSLARERVPVCIFLEVNPPGKSGIDILKKFRAEDYPAPIFVTSGQGNIPMAVDVIRNGASDFIQKPVTGSEIVDRVNAVVAGISQTGGNLANIHHPAWLPTREPLTRRERDVLVHLAHGASSKEIALRLGLSWRTVESHRAGIMRKVGVKTAAELVRVLLSGYRGH